MINTNKCCVQSGQFNVDDKITSGSGQVVEGFKIYINSGPSLACRIPTSKYFNPHSMYVAHVETSGIYANINGTKKSSAGWDGIHAKIVKNNL